MEPPDIIGGTDIDIIDESQPAEVTCWLPKIPEVVL